MKLAEKFKLPVITFMDTIGAYPGIGAEERGQGEAIAKNIMEMTKLKVPIICIIIGEGASGGAIGIGLGDRVFMLENTWYSVISPESCSSILWRSWDYKEQAAEALKLTAEHMLEFKLIDGIIKEPLGGAHRNKTLMITNIKNSLKKNLQNYDNLSPEEILNERKNRFLKIGRSKGFINNIEELSSVKLKSQSLNMIFQNNRKLILISGIIILIFILISFFL